MAWFVSLIGLVALVQGVGWAGREGPRRLLGSLLAPAGLLLFALGVVWGLIPDFFVDNLGFDGR